MTATMISLLSSPHFQRAPKPVRAKPRLEGPLEKWRYLLPEIDFLIHATEDHIVFLDGEIDVDWVTTEEYDERGHRDESKFHLILNRVATLETTPCAELPSEMKAQFKRLVAEGLDRGLSHDYDGAQSILNTAADYILARSQETSRCWYLSASAMMTIPFFVVGCLFWIWRDHIELSIGDGPFWLAMSAIAGAAGALLSVIGRTGKLHFGSSSGKLLHYLEGASRIWAGAFSGLFVGLAVRADLVLAALTRTGKAPAIMILAAMASGAGERLANSIIADLDKPKGHGNDEATGSM
jgi:hypothetical protein